MWKLINFIHQSKALIMGRQAQTKNFTGVIIHNEKTGLFIGIIKELKGVVVQGRTKDEVVKKMPRAIEAMMSALRKKFQDTINPG